MFGNILDSEIKNIGVEEINLTGNDRVAGLVGYLDVNNKITNSYATGSAIGRNDVSLLVGDAGDTTITNSYAIGNVTGSFGVGGLVGGMGNSSIIHSYATGSVSGSSYYGGLVGGVGSSCNITNSYANGIVGQGGYSQGGLAGSLTGSCNITNSYYNKDTSGQNDTGRGVGVTTAELNKMLSDGTLPDFTLKTASKSNEIIFQIGIDSKSSSQIALDTAFMLNVSSLRGIGNGGNYLSQIDNMINTISSKQTEYGAAENRLESALEEISTQYDNLVSSRSTLRDADIAEVSSDYIRQQILQQASATLLATANQSPSLALQLI